MRFDAIDADAENLRVQVTKRENIVAKLARFGRATRRFVFRVEIQNDPLIAIVLERMQLPGLVGQFELRRPIADAWLRDR